MPEQRVIPDPEVANETISEDHVAPDLPLSTNNPNSMSTYNSVEDITGFSFFLVLSISDDMCNECWKHVLRMIAYCLIVFYIKLFFFLWNNFFN